MNNKLVRQILCPVLAAAIWGSAFVFQSVAADYVPPFAFNAMRSAVGAAFLGLILLIKKGVTKKKSAPGTVKKTLIGGAICGIALAVATNLQQAGLADTGAGKAGFITALYIVIVPILGLFLKRRTNILIWISVVLAAIGLYFLCVSESFTVSTSDLILMLCALTYAVHIMFIDSFSTGCDSIAFSCVQFAVAGIISAALSLIFETVDMQSVRSVVWNVLYVGIFSSGIAYTLQIFAQQASNPTVVSLLLSLESVFATLCGAVILHETLIAREYAGCVIMLAAVCLAQIPLPKKKNT